MASPKPERAQPVRQLMALGISSTDDSEHIFSYFGAGHTGASPFFLFFS